MRIDLRNGVGLDILDRNEFRRFNDFDFESRGCERSERRECGGFERRLCGVDERRDCCGEERRDPPRAEDFRNENRRGNRACVRVNVFADCDRRRRGFDGE